MSFGEEIVRKRKEMKLTQIELAKLLERHVKTISNWEQDKNVPDEKTRREVCRALGIDFENAFLDYDSDLFPDEQQLLRLYRRLNAEGKAVVQHLAEMLCDYQASNNRKAMVSRAVSYRNALRPLSQDESKEELE